jgi:hypothetical protein
LDRLRTRILAANASHRSRRKDFIVAIVGCQGNHGVPECISAAVFTQNAIELRDKWSQLGDKVRFDHR